MSEKQTKNIMDMSHSCALCGKPEAKHLGREHDLFLFCDESCESAFYQRNFNQQKEQTSCDVFPNNDSKQ